MSSNVIDLSEFIDKKSSFCLNTVNEEDAIQYLLNQSNVTEVSSDADEQLIISYKFNEKVTLEGMNIYCDSKKLANAPKIVKLYVNRSNMSFDDVESLPVSQELDLEAKDLQEDGVISLKRVKFTNIVNLTIFIESNQDDEDVTLVHGIKVFGKPQQSANVSEIQKVKHGEE